MSDKITVAQLNKFVRTRNKSPHQSNLQFMCDAEACGFKVDDMPAAEKVEQGHYRWKFESGTLEEIHGRMTFEKA